eukprot:3028555-Pyramimonas_sp.AAC.1
MQGTAALNFHCPSTPPNASLPPPPPPVFGPRRGRLFWCQLRLGVADPHALFITYSERTTRSRSKLPTT